MAIIILPEKYDKELKYQQYFQWVIVMSPLASYGKMHCPRVVGRLRLALRIR